MLVVEAAADVFARALAAAKGVFLEAAAAVAVLAALLGLVMPEVGQQVASAPLVVAVLQHMAAVASQ